MKEMEYAISQFGVRTPKIVYGTAWKKERTAGLVEQALRLGFRGIDTACQPKHYNEPGVGVGLAACLNSVLAREEIFLQSKFTSVNGQDSASIPYDPKASLADQVVQSVETSLRNLRTDYLDCLVLHSPLASEGDTLAVWRAMEAIFAAGGARQLGISNCYELSQLDNLYRNANVKPAVLQNRFYAKTQYDKEIRVYCREHQMLYQGFWTLTANPNVLLDSTVLKLASTYRRTPEQIFYRFLTQSDIIPLTGTTDEAHMRDDLAIFSFELTPSECDALCALL